MNYQHTQIGIAVLVALALISLLIIIIFSFVGWHWIPAIVLAILAISAFLFHSLTVQITDNQLRLWFGPGFIQKTYPLSEIVRAEAVKNRWYYGWGIKLIPRGWLFNVSGLDAMEVTLESGKRVRIGTDRPQELEIAIRRSVGLESPEV